jgi:hypothetical protein
MRNAAKAITPLLENDPNEAVRLIEKRTVYELWQKRWIR